MLLLGKPLLSGRWTLVGKEHREGWTKGLSEVRGVHILLEESISLMDESVFKVYWFLKGISFRCYAQQSTSSVKMPQC